MPSLLVDRRDDGVAVVTLNRPEVRNALDRKLLLALSGTMATLDTEPGVRAIVLTGADPAFCAGLDLRVLGDDPAGGLLGGLTDPGDTRDRGGFWRELATPVIGAVNGAAVTGGLEVALQCDMLLASERARFADTHARVGVMPAGGMTVRLPAAVGMARAVEMSLTGRFVGAVEAQAWGLVTRVVDHASLLDEAVAMASSIAEVDARAASTILAMYRTSAALPGAEAARAELDAAGRWRREDFDPAAVAARRDAVIDRGRRQMP